MRERPIRRFSLLILIILLLANLVTQNVSRQTGRPLTSQRLERFTRFPETNVDTSFHPIRVITENSPRPQLDRPTRDLTESARKTEQSTTGVERETLHFESTLHPLVSENDDSRVTHVNQKEPTTVPLNLQGNSSAIDLPNHQQNTTRNRHEFGPEMTKNTSEDHTSEDLEGTCGNTISDYQCANNTCLGRCGQVNNYTDGYWFCSCDSGCQVYGDCCTDFQDVCRNHTGDNVNQDEAPFNCKAVEPDRYIYMKQSCHPDYKNKTVIENCHAAKGIEGILPVTDTLNNIVYANYFCAMCNLAADNLKHWDISLKCRMSAGIPRRIDNSNIVNMLKQVETMEISRKKCLVYKIQSVEGSNMRPCIPLSSPCSQRCKSKTYKQACELGPRDPQHTVSLDSAVQFFRNAYCFKCNSGKAGCSEFWIGKTDDQFGFISYSILTDFVGDSGFKLRLKSHSGVGGVDSTMLVKDSRVNMLRCPTQFRLVNGECVFNETTVKSSCKIPKSNAVSSNVKEIEKLLMDVFDIMGTFYIKDRPSYVYCSFLVSIPNDSLDWRKMLVRNDYILQSHFPSVDPAASVRYCVFDGVPTNLTFSNTTRSKNTGPKKIKASSNTANWLYEDFKSRILIPLVLFYVFY